MEQWSHWIKRQVGASTAERYACSLEQLAPWLDGKDLLEIEGPLIATIVAERSKVVTNATIKRDLTALSSVLDFAIDQGYRDDNPVLPRARRIKERRDPIVLPQKEHIALAVNRAPGMMGHLIQAAKATGARRGELLKAQPDDIDDARRQMTLIGKGNKLRVIDLDPYEGFDHLTSLPTFSEVFDRYLFWHHDGRPYSADEFNSVFRQLMETTAAWAQANGVGFRRFRFHDLRHWHAVHFLKDRYGTIYDLKERLGHSSVTVTEGYLKYLTPDEQRFAKYGGMAKSIAEAPVVAGPDRKKVPN